jgi:hypothetical protein|tara:strand:- start:2988 stop:4451 length:1464 start_codon:yes stop_codon:yes gene_type:complete
MGQPVIAGGNIIRRPQENLEGLLGGVGEIIGAIRQQRGDKAVASELENTLAGFDQGRNPQLPAAAQGFTTAQPLIGQDRLSAILNASLDPRASKKLSDRLQTTATIMAPNIRQTLSDKAALERTEDLIEGRAAVQTASDKAALERTELTVGSKKTNYTINTYNDDGSVKQKQLLSLAPTDIAGVLASLGDNQKLLLGNTTVPKTGKQNAIRTNPDGTKSKVKATLQEIDKDSNLTLVEQKDRLATHINAAGGISLVNLDKQTVTPLEEDQITGAEIGGVGDPSFDPSFDPRESFLNAEEVVLGTGLMSKIRTGYARLLGPFLGGVQAGGTRQMTTDLNLVSQAIIERLRINKNRFTAIEKNMLEKLIPNTKSLLEDPEVVWVKLKEASRYFEFQNQTDRRRLQGTLTLSKRKEILDDVSQRDAVIALIPSIPILEHLIDPTTPLNANQFRSLGQIKVFNDSVKLDDRSRSDWAAIRARATELIGRRK